MTIPTITATHVKALAAPTYLGGHAALILAEPGTVTLGSVFACRPVLAIRGDIVDLTDQPDWENGMLRDKAADRVARYLNDMVADRLYAGGWFGPDDDEYPTVEDLVGELKDNCGTADLSDSSVRVVIEGEAAELDWRVRREDCDAVTLVVRRRLGA